MMTSARGGSQLFGLLRGHCDRLLAKDMLARPRRRERERDVQMVGKRIVDGIDVRIGKHLLIRAVGASLRQTQSGQRAFGTAAIARSERDYLRMRRFHDPGRDFRHADIGCRNNSPANFAIRHHQLPLGGSLVSGNTQLSLRNALTACSALSPATNSSWSLTEVCQNPVGATRLPQHTTLPHAATSAKTCRRGQGLNECRRSGLPFGTTLEASCARTECATKGSAGRKRSEKTGKYQLR